MRNTRSLRHWRVPEWTKHVNKLCQRLWDRLPKQTAVAVSGTDPLKNTRDVLDVIINYYGFPSILQALLSYSRHAPHKRDALGVQYPPLGLLIFMTMEQVGMIRSGIDIPLLKQCIIVFTSTMPTDQDFLS